MLSTKNYSNNSSVNATTATFTYLEVQEATINNVNTNISTISGLINTANNNITTISGQLSNLNNAITITGTAATGYTINIGNAISTIYLNGVNLYYNNEKLLTQDTVDNQATFVEYINQI